jgi:hypothetical protein
MLALAHNDLPGADSERADKQSFVSGLANTGRREMKILSGLICIGLVAALVQQPVLAQRGGRGPGGGHGGDGAGINYAPRPAVYEVLSVDPGSSTVRLRAADGRAGDVYVDQGVYDLSSLKAGDKIQVDFLVPDGTNTQLKAASVWPAN